MNRIIIQIRIKERLEQGIKKNEYCHKEKEGIISLQDVVHMSSGRGDVSAARRQHDIAVQKRWRYEVEDGISYQDDRIGTIKMTDGCWLFDYSTTSEGAGRKGGIGCNEYLGGT